MRKIMIRSSHSRNLISRQMLQLQKQMVMVLDQYSRMVSGGMVLRINQVMVERYQWFVSHAMRWVIRVKTVQGRMVDIPIMDHLSVIPVTIATWNATPVEREDTRAHNVNQNRISTIIQQLVRRITQKW